MNLNEYIDHTLLKPDASLDAIVKLCDEAREHHFASVCVNPCFVPVCHKLLAGTKVKVCTVIGFPLGATFPEIKKAEAMQAVKEGAEEIDMVQNISLAKAHDYEFIAKEVALVKEGCNGKLLKVILETCLLSDDEIVESAKAAVKGGADYVKTSTGFSKGGATTHAVKLMRDAVPENIGVKASGGVRNKEDAIEFINLGATRIGTSHGVEIVKDSERK